MTKEWLIQIIGRADGKVDFIYDKNVNQYQLIGLLEIELGLLKKGLIDNMVKEG